MTEVRIDWHEVVKLEHASKEKDFSIEGVYLHLLHLGNGKNVFYVGESSEIRDRQCMYLERFKSPPNMERPAFTTFDIDKMKTEIRENSSSYQDIHSFLCGNRLESSVKRRFVFLGDEPVPPDISQREFSQMRVRFVEAIYVCVGSFEQSGDPATRMAVEATLLRYLKNRYNFDDYNNGSNIIGLNRGTTKQRVHILNCCRPAAAEWLTDLPVEL